MGQFSAQLSRQLIAISLDRIAFTSLTNTLAFEQQRYAYCVTLLEVGLACATLPRTVVANW